MGRVNTARGKLHLAADEASQEILATAVTTNDVGENEVFVDLLAH